MKLVDSGSFSIFHAGQRVATETFRIEQNATHSVTTSEIKSGQGDSEVSQSSELEIASNGDLLKYSWHQSKPDKSEFTLEPDQQVLMQHYTGTKTKQDLPYVLPVNSSILDDYFFVHREVLTWRYLASECANTNPCNLTPAQFGVVIPHQHTSETVSMDYKGQEKVMVKGAEQNLRHFILHSGDLDWSLYLDDNQKLVKVEIPAEQTEAVRD
jgi:hypothetical protein